MADRALKSNKISIDAIDEISIDAIDEINIDAIDKFSAKLINNKTLETFYQNESIL